MYWRTRSRADSARAPPVNAATRTVATPVLDLTPALMALPFRLGLLAGGSNSSLYNSPILAKIADGEYCHHNVPRERKYESISFNCSASSPTHSPSARSI